MKQVMNRVGQRAVQEFASVMTQAFIIVVAVSILGIAPARADPSGGLGALGDILRNSDISKSLRLSREAGRLVGSAMLASECQRIADWSKRLETEYPKDNFYRTTIVHIYPKAVKLFGDESFVPYFGKPYDQFGDTELEGIWKNVLSQCFTSPEYRGSFTWQRAVLGRPFQLRGGIEFNRARVSQAVVAMRDGRRELAQIQAELPSLPGSSAGLDRLNALEGRAKSLRDQLWPSEQGGVEAALSATRTRVAEPALAEKINAELAEARGYDGALALKRSLSQHREVLASLAPEVRRGYEQRIQQKISGILTSLIDAEAAKLGQVGGGLAGLERGAMWYREFRGRYGKEFDDQTPVRALDDRFLEKRRAQLASAGAELSGLVRRASSETEVDRLLARALGVPGDTAHPAVAEAMRIAEARKEQLQKQRVLADSSPPPPGNRTSRPRPSGNAEPNHEEMYDALKAQVDGANTGYRELKERCERRDFRDDPLIAMQCLALCGGTGGTCKLEIRITRFQKLGCEKAVGQSGYVCDFAIGLQTNGLAVPASLRDIMQSGNAGQGRFLRQGDYWLFLPLDRQSD
ncbi:MAG: hypothetical protein IPI02_18365 [Sterolibacteriaceae bacterium]|nr:hypothetical protein [Sterolibacteriaceae bacterium]